MIKHRLNAKLPEQLALQLEKAIHAQQHRPGQRLPPERAWALQLGVSRAALREALGLLTERGLLVRRHGAGTWVAERSDERRADPWKQMLQRQPLMQADLLEFREMLEVRCAELAAQRAGPEDIARLTERHDAVQAAYAQEDRGRQVRADVAFHRAVADATRNPVFSYLVASLLEMMHEHVLLSIAQLDPASAASRQLRQQHGALYQRIVAGDAAGAARSARRHIEFVRGHWESRLGMADGEPAGADADPAPVLKRSARASPRAGRPAAPAPADTSPPDA